MRLGTRLLCHSEGMTRRRGTTDRTHVAMEEDSRIEFSIRIASHHPQCDVGLPSAFSVCYVWKIRGLFCTFAEPQALVSAVSAF